MLPYLPPTQVNYRNRTRPINPQDSAATTGLVSNPNGTYVSNPFPTTAQNGMQGAFGAMLPSVNVGNPNAPTSPLFNALQSGALTSSAPVNSPLFNTLKNLPINTPSYPDYAQRHPELSQPNLPQLGTPESLALANKHYQAQQQMKEERVVNGVIAALQQGDLSALSQLPAADLEAMGLGEFASSGVGGGANESDSDYVKRMTEIGTGVDEGKDMTPAQLEERYYKNKAIEAEFLNAKRWDAKKKKYVTVGQWLKQERNKYNKHGRRRSGRGGGGGQERIQPEQPKEEVKEYTVQQAGVVNFNTATG